MPFRVAARTILQLGAELISSDAIAFYELIKNSFDAGSPEVDITVIVRIPYEIARDAREALLEAKKKGSHDRKTNAAVEAVREQVARAIMRSEPRADRLLNRVSEAGGIDELMVALEGGNYIEIKDSGEGMSLDDLNTAYLTIGTRARLVQRIAQIDQAGDGSDSHRPVLGEKGVGRLSAMRLGRRLLVRSTKKGETRWNILEIDWTKFSHDSDALIDEVDLTPRKGKEKDDASMSGTLIRISGLISEWSRGKLEGIARQEFSKLTDPFTPSSRYPIHLRFQDEALYVPAFNKILFEHAHASVEARFVTDSDEDMHLSGRIDYLLRKRERSFRLAGPDLLSCVNIDSPRVLRSLGPFSVKLYWFNRRILSAIEGIGELKQVRELVADWAGGLMVYRDGFRVNPYGGPDDDWLELDRTALASGGYKVNRRQIIGKVDISGINNRALMDQTNREGLRDCDEKHALITLLRHVLLAEFKTFLDSVDKEVQAREPISFDELEERVASEEEQVQQSLRVLLVKHPEVRQDTEIVGKIRDAVNQIRRLMNEAKELAESFQKGRTELLHLAGLGLMVEIIAHELNRATSHTLDTLSSADRSRQPARTPQVFATLEAQLKTLQKRLRILDPLSTAGRQRKESFDLISWVQDILRSHEGQFQRHGIRYTLEVRPQSRAATLRITAVKGMIVQILENLISNSVYWIKQQRKIDNSFRPYITVTIDTQTKQIRFADNGPGIDPERNQWVFQPFTTTKPPGEGKGLGLYISREIAKYNNAALYLADEFTIHEDRLNTFVLALDVGEK